MDYVTDLIDTTIRPSEIYLDENIPIYFHYYGPFIRLNFGSTVNMTIKQVSSKNRFILLFKNFHHLLKKS